MKLYHTRTSPYARLVRIVILEKGLQDRIELVEAKTRTPGSPYYQINPSGRVPYLVRDDGSGMEDSQLIVAYLDQIDGRPMLTPAAAEQDWAYGRLESYARSMVDGISVHLRELRRPESERSPTILAHEAERARRLAAFWDREVAHPLMQGPLNVAMLILAIALDTGVMAKLGALEQGLPKLEAWAAAMRARASVKATAPNLV